MVRAEEASASGRDRTGAAMARALDRRDARSDDRSGARRCRRSGGASGRARGCGGVRSASWADPPDCEPRRSSSSARESRPDAAPAGIEEPVADHADHSIPRRPTPHREITPLGENALAAESHLRNLVHGQIGGQVIDREASAAIASADTEFDQQSLPHPCRSITHPASLAEGNGFARPFSQPSRSSPGRS